MSSGNTPQFSLALALVDGRVGKANTLHVVPTRPLYISVALASSGRSAPTGAAQAQIVSNSPPPNYCEHHGLAPTLFHLPFESDNAQEKSRKIAPYHLHNKASIESQHSHNILLCFNAILDGIKRSVVTRLPHLYIRSHCALGAF